MFNIITNSETVNSDVNSGVKEFSLKKSNYCKVSKTEKLCRSEYGSSRTEIFDNMYMLKLIFFFFISKMRQWLQ